MNDTPTGAAEHEPVRKLSADADRRRVTDELSEALGRGQLEFAEFEERSARAWACRYRDELVSLVADVHDSPETVAGLRPSTPDSPVPFAGERSPGRFSPRQAVELVKGRITGQADGSALSVSMMGGASRSGDWLCPNNHTSITVMGGNAIDLREARFESGEIRIMAFAVMGGIEIIVPEGVRVICDGMGIMGGFDASVDKEASVRPADLPADAPVVRVGGIALMGGIGVVTKPRE